MDRVADVVVIGAGVIGCAIAFEFARNGRRVTVVERAKGPGMGSTSASSAIIRFNYSTYAGVATAWEGRHCWEDWERFLGGTDDGALARFHRTGALVLDADCVDVSRTDALFDEVGVPFEHWTAAEVRAHVPGIDTGRHYPPKPVDSEEFWEPADGELGGIFTPDAGFVDDPSFAAHNLMVAAQCHGAVFRFGASVVSVHSRSGRVSGVALGDGTVLSCNVIINVTGPNSGQVNAMAGVLDDFRIHTRPLRQEVHELPGDGSAYPMVADLDLGSYFRSTPSGRLLIGGTEPECDPLHWLDDPDVYALTATRETYEAHAYRVARRLPGAGVPTAVSGIAGVYDVSTDWVPIYDRTSLDGFYVAVGTSGNQFKNAPVVGGFLHALVVATESGVDHDANPVQYRLPRTGLTVNLGDFSRLRDPAVTAGNVMG